MNYLATKNIMIDIETFGRRPNGLIVSIGAIAFSSAPEDISSGTIFSGKPEDFFHDLLSLEAAETETRFVKDPNTLRWWKESNQVAYQKLRNLMRLSSLDSLQLLTKFVSWLKPFCDQGYNIIGNSPSFDLVIIENACNVLGVPFPVPYRSETDYRTLTDLIWEDGTKPRPAANDAHDALFDAKFQAEVYVRAMQTVRRWKMQSQPVGDNAERLREYYDTTSQWGSHPDHPMEDWQGDAARGETRLGYWPWVLARLEENRSPMPWNIA